MNLPDSVTYCPRQPSLMAFDAPAWLRLRRDAPGLRDYEIKDRRFDTAIAPFLHGDWEAYDRRAPLVREGVVYSGADHTGRPPLPSITLLPNLRHAPGGPLGPERRVLGCTMGHWHHPSPSGARTQEIYEYQSYGLMVLDNEEGDVDVWVLQDGDKVAVPAASHMTLYNLDDDAHPLVTLDFADPARNPADKSLIRRHGPILLAYYDEREVVFQVSRPYVNATEMRAGVRLAGPVPTDEALCVRLPRDPNRALGAQLHERLTRDPEVARQFLRCGLRLRAASPEVVLEDHTHGSRRCVSAEPLAVAAQPGHPIHRFFLE